MGVRDEWVRGMSGWRDECGVRDECGWVLRGECECEDEWVEG